MSDRTDWIAALCLLGMVAGFIGGMLWIAG